MTAGGIEGTELRLRVGALYVTAGQAERWVRRYLNTPAENWSYPAYDGYPGAPGPEIGLQDLFAPTLLNVPIRKLRTYYELERALPFLNEQLRDVPVDVALAEASDEEIGKVARIFGILDDPRLEIYGVKLTTLAKIVHRKRPGLVPLWDERIERCYQASRGAPVPYKKGRTWETFTGTWITAVKADLTATPEVTRAWAELAQLTPPGQPSITPLRALDIVGWFLGRRTVAAESDRQPPGMAAEG